MSIMADVKYTNLFGSPLVARVWEDAASLNEALQEKIFAHEAATAGLDRTNAGGWHSESGQLEFCGDAGRQLVRQMYELGDEATRRVLTEYGHKPRPMRWTLQAWVNVNRSGNYNKVHTHPGSTWSGTYYVDPGDPPPDAEHGTPLHFFDPCQGRANTFLPPFVPSSILVRPEPGLMVLFPSYLPHTVLPHEGTRPRISIAFNLRKEPYP
jgi:uncharacterized protein (TIGR02466 family)